MSHALSNSGLTDLLISPLEYWHRHVNPKRKIEPPTAAQQFGKAVHAAVLEPEEFAKQYCEKFTGPEGCLYTVNDLRQWLIDKGKKPKGMSKGLLIGQVQALDANVPIYDVLKDAYDEQNFGKVQFSADDWERITGAAQALRDEPELAEILNDPDGKAEVKFKVEYFGVKLRGRMDWVTPKATLEIKTFAPRRGRPFDKEVTNAIWYEGYHRQGYFYSLARAITWFAKNARAEAAPPFLFAFVSSAPPFETRLREFGPRELGQRSLLWQHAERQVLAGIEMYREYLKEFGAGETPWRHAQRIELLREEEFSQLAFGG